MSDLLFVWWPRSLRPQPVSIVSWGITFITLLAPVSPTFSSIAQAQIATGQTLSPAAQKALAAQQALAARDRTFELLQRQSGPVDAPDTGVLRGAHDLDGWLWSRYRAVTADSTLSKARSQRLVAGLVHQDLQLAEDALQSSDTVVRRRGLRVATIANLYASSLTDDPRLEASLYQGFLLPTLDLAPRTGWGSAQALLEGASVAFGLSGRAQEQRNLLGTLLQMQQGTGNVPGADMARVHLSSALEDEGDLRGAYQQLDAITTPDLLGAKARMQKLAQEIRDQERAQASANQDTTPQPFEIANAGTATPTQTPANTNPAVTPQTKGTTGAGQATANGNGGGAGMGQPGGTLNPGFGATVGGRRLAQNAGERTAGEQNAGEQNGGPGIGDQGADGAADNGIGNDGTTGDEAIDGESEAMRHVRLATQAAKKAYQLSKKEEELATISLAKWLDASDAQSALDAANATADGAAAAGATATGALARAATPGRTHAPQPSLLVLQDNAQKTALAASEAAGDAKRASLAAQEAHAEAARLGLLVFGAAQNTPQVGDGVSPATATQLPAETPPVTATQTQIVPQVAAPEVQTR